MTLCPLLEQALSRLFARLSPGEEPEAWIDSQIRLALQSWGWRAERPVRSFDELRKLIESSQGFFPEQELT